MSKKSAIKKIVKDDGYWTEDYSDVTGCMVIYRDKNYYFIDVNAIKVIDSGSVLLYNVPEDCSENVDLIASFPSSSVAYLVKYNEIDMGSDYSLTEVRTYDVY
jgi:hypothetical protein